MDFESKVPKANSRQGHEHFAQLCALFTSGSLTKSEQRELDEHLAGCKPCADLLREYRTVAKSGIPLLAPVHHTESVNDAEPWSVETAKKRLLYRVAADKATQQTFPQPRASRNPLRFFLPKMPSMARIAAGLVLIASALAFAYRTGQANGRNLAQESPQPSSVESRPPSLPVSTDQNSSLDAQLSAQSNEVQKLQQELKRQTAAISESRSAQDKLQREAQERGSMIAALDSDKTALAAERDGLNHKLRETQDALLAAQQRLDSLQQEQNRQLLRAASLQSNVEELSSKLKESQDVAQRDQGYLAYDRDIRELMGARDLYIADVFDIDREGKTRKPFGRVFYTGGKSLLFYAFDLDRQPGVRQASTFQVWGRRGLGDKRPLNMGILYEDNSVNRRWVLRFDDPKVLAEIDAVFVTVEPGSKTGQKPTGRQLLFASLRTPPNHP
jgi:hypothetical protein